MATKQLGRVARKVTPSVARAKKIYHDAWLKLISARKYLPFETEHDRETHAKFSALIDDVFYEGAKLFPAKS